MSQNVLVTKLIRVNILQLTKERNTLKENLQLNKISEAARLMYMICGFETAWHENTESPWCKLFSIHDFKVSFQKILVEFIITMNVF